MLLLWWLIIRMTRIGIDLYCIHLVLDIEHDM
jgi:hypothetical protein